MKLRRGPLWTIAGCAALTVACAAAVAIGITSATADNNAGKPVPAEELAVIKTAATSCPTLSPPRLAGQIMATSGFDPQAVTDAGGTGIAGLTTTDWAQWAPAAAAARTDIAANLIALAHDMCDLAGRLRVANVTGDGWRNALAAFHSGLPAVIDAGGVPGGAATYVDKSASFAAWYALQPEFGGPGVVASVPAPVNSQTPSAVAAGSQPSTHLAAPPVSPAAPPAPTAGATTPPAQTADAPPQPPQPAGEEIIGEESGRCADVVGGSHNANTAIDIWDCTGVPNQKWVRSGDTIQVYGSMCLDAPSTNAMTRVVIRSCDGSVTQKWTVHGDKTITHNPDGLCLDAMGYVTDNGTPLQIWPCAGGSNERWTIG